MGRLRRRPKKPTTGHYMVMSQELGIYVCVADHQCGEVRDRYGRPLKAPA